MEIYENGKNCGSELLFQKERVLDAAGGYITPGFRRHSPAGTGNEGSRSWLEWKLWAFRFRPEGKEICYPFSLGKDENADDTEGVLFLKKERGVLRNFREKKS